MKREIQWETVDFLLHEAVERLELLEAMLEKARTGVAPRGWKKMLGAYDEITEVRLAEVLSAAYRHLNMAWNARYCRPSEMDRDIRKMERFPAYFTRQWNRTIK